MLTKFARHYRDPSCIDATQVMGFIVNVPTEYKFGMFVLPYRRRHWIAIRRIENAYWNLDSKLNAPERIGNDAAVIEYLRNQLKSNDMELFVVVRSETEQNKLWLKDELR